MYSLIIAYILIQLFLITFFKRDKRYVYCGIFAFSAVRGISQEQIRKALQNIKILGMFNEDRGGQGAGLFINNEIIKVADTHKKFPELIANNVLEMPNENHVMIGHCRKSSRGVVSLENTHPFLINEDLVGVHNGTIENIYDLAKKFKIDATGIINDSRQLYMIIEQDGVEVLNEYKGGAALIWTRLSEPNTLSVFHGESKKFTNGKVEEERPLFFMKTPEGIYFSSISDSLWAIRDDHETMPEILPFNVVLHVQDGRFIGKDTHIDREEANVWRPSFPANGASSSSNLPARSSSATSHLDPYDEVFGYENGGKIPIPFNDYGSTGSKIGKTYAIKSLTDLEPMVWRETYPKEDVEMSSGYSVYFHKGRYYKVKGELCNGEMFLLKRGVVATEADMYKATAYYFWQGIMMKSRQAFQDFMGLLSESKIAPCRPDCNLAATLARFSMFPITNLPSESANIDKRHLYRWYSNNGVATESFTPKFSGRHYKIKDGYLIDISNSHDKRQKTLHDHYNDINPIVVEEEAADDQTSNFQEGNKGTAEIQDEHLDKKHESIKKLYETIPVSYLNGMIDFVTDKFSTKQDLEFDKAQAYYELDNLLRRSIKQKITIREALEDTEHWLERYIKSHAISQRITNKVEDTSFQQFIADDSTAMMEQRNGEEDVEENDEIANALEAFEKSQEKLEQDFRDLSNANDIVGDIIDDCESLANRVNELNGNECAFAQKASEIVYHHIDSIKKEMVDCAKEHSTSEILQKLNDAII